MKKVCVILPSNLPIPTVNGGAVETLVEYIINENEKSKRIVVDVITVENNQAIQEESKYKHAKFYHYKDYTNKLINFIYKQIYRFLKQVFRIYIPCSINYVRMIKILKKIESNYDYILYEAGETSQIPIISKIVGKDRLLVHLHWSGIWKNANLSKIDKSFIKLIPVSNYIAKNWKNNTDRDINSIIPLYNCANLSLFSKKISQNEKNNLKSKLHIPNDNKVLIFIGRIIKEKGVKELIEAFNMLNNKNITLLIIGSRNFGKYTNSKYEVEVQRLIKECDKQIVFTGYIHQSELYKYYSISDLAIMPSLVNEAAPLVCIEAQSTGTPLIVTKVGGVPEYVSKDSVCMVEVDEKIVYSLSSNIDLLINDSKKRKNMSLAAVENSKKYSIENYYNDFLNIICGDNNEKKK